MRTSAIATSRSPRVSWRPAASPSLLCAQNTQRWNDPSVVPTRTSYRGVPCSPEDLPYLPIAHSRGLGEIDRTAMSVREIIAGA